MRRSILFSLAVVCLILLSGIFAQLIAQNLDVKKLTAEAERIRGIKFEKEVETKTITREEFKKYLEKEIERQGITKEICKKKSRVGVKFGFYPAEYDMYKEALELMGGAAAAIYDPVEKCVLMIEQKKNEADKKLADGMEAMRAQLMRMQQESILIHELTHALDDQVYSVANHLDLKKKAADRRSDKILAVKALMEGSALSTQYTYLLMGLPTYKKVPDLGHKYVEEAIKQNAVVGRQPEAMQLSLLWVYEGGTDLVHKLLEKGGQDELNKAMKDPPVTTEQVLHPEEKYLKRDDPTTIQIDENKLSEILKDWELIEENNLGELFTIVFLKKYIGKDEAQKAAAGWDGDEYAAFGGKEEKELAIIWLTVWDSEKDRNEFFDSYKKAVEKKYEAKAKDGEDRFTMNTKEGNVFAQKKGKFVLCIDGAPDAKLEKLTEEAWKNAKEQEEEKKEGEEKKYKEETKEEK
jgi:hypothetical protein